MSRSAAQTTRNVQKRALLDLLPDQGAWTDEEYLWLTDHTNRLVEFTDGFVEVLPLPTDRHQSILKFLFLAFHAFLTPLGGNVQFAALRVRLREGKFREPDLLLVLDAKDPRRQNRFWTGADLVLEVVSADHPERDLVQKRHEYAEARIGEYWIANPLNETISVYKLRGQKYPRARVSPRGTAAQSFLLPGLSIRVDEVFDAD